MVGVLVGVLVFVLVFVLVCAQSTLHAIKIDSGPQWVS